MAKAKVKVKVKVKSAFGPVAHQAGAYPGFCSMKRHLGGERHRESEARTRSARSGVERASHEATAPPTAKAKLKAIFHGKDRN